MDKSLFSILTESTYRQILDAMQDLIFVKNRSSVIIWGNRAYCEYYKVSAAEVDQIQPETQYMDADTIVFRTGRDVSIPEEEILRHDGVAKIFHTVKSPIFDSTGTPSGLVGVARDLTERLSTEVQLRRSEEFIEAFLDNTPSVVYVKDREGRHLVVNNRYCQITTLSKQELLGKTVYEVFPKEIAEIMRANDLLILDSGNAMQFEEKAMVNGFLRTFISSKFPLKDPLGHTYAVCGISTDITDRVETEKMLQEERAHKTFNTKMAALGEMAGGIAHEINTPLTTLKVLSNQLSAFVVEPELNRELIKEMSDIIEKTTDRIADIVKSLISFSRDGSSDAMVEVPIKKMIEGTLSFCRSKFNEHQVQLLVSDIDESWTVQGREVELSQVVVNLLNNAFDAVQTSKEKVISIAVSCGFSNIQIGITDSGSGVEPDIREKIFQPFLTTKEVGKGAGVGLSISRRIIESHGGSLTLDSESLQTRFVILIPKSK